MAIFSIWSMCWLSVILLSDSQRQGFDVEIAQIAVILIVLIWVLDYSGCWCNVPISKNMSSSMGLGWHPILMKWNIKSIHVWNHQPVRFSRWIEKTSSAMFSSWDHPINDLQIGADQWPCKKSWKVMKSHEKSTILGFFHFFYLFGCCYSSSLGYTWHTSIHANSRGLWDESLLIVRLSQAVAILHLLCPLQRQWTLVWWIDGPFQSFQEGIAIHSWSDWSFETQTRSCTARIAGISIDEVSQTATDYSCYHLLSMLWLV